MVQGSDVKRMRAREKFFFIFLRRGKGGRKVVRIRYLLVFFCFCFDIARPRRSSMVYYIYLVYVIVYKYP